MLTGGKDLSSSVRRQRRRESVAPPAPRWPVTQCYKRRKDTRRDEFCLNGHPPHTSISCCRYEVRHVRNEGHAVLSAEEVPVAAR
jgi:hypothetical protein